MAAARSAASRRPGACAGRGHPSSAVTVLGVSRAEGAAREGRLRRSPGSVFYGSHLHICLICYQGSLVRRPRLPAVPVPRIGCLGRRKKGLSRDSAKRKCPGHVARRRSQDTGAHPAVLGSGNCSRPVAVLLSVHVPLLGAPEMPQGWLRGTPRAPAAATSLAGI